MTGTSSGRVALVTGAASGIGRATALAFGKEGAHVVVADRDEAGAAATAAAIRNGGARALAVRCDVTQSADVRSLVDRTVSEFGRLDCAFNNAGTIGPPLTTLPDYPEEDWNAVLATNLTSVFLCLKHQIPVMIEQGGGSIVNSSSIVGKVAFPGFAAYVATKHAVAGLTRTAALECAEKGVRVNAVCPGVIETPLVRFITDSPELTGLLRSMHPVKRFGKPEEVASAVTWLCSDAASYVTGQLLDVDGGYLAQ